MERKKKIFVLVFGFALVLFLCVAISGCLWKRHEHEWDTAWTSDNNKHWHVCLDCSSRKGVESHHFDHGSCICGLTLLKYEAEGDGYVVNWLNGYQTEEEIDLVIPATYQGKAVRAIKEMAFCSCKNLTGITIPDSVTRIGACAFAFCKGLTNIVIPNSVTTLGAMVFAGCENLTSITIGSGVEKLNERLTEDEFFDESKDDAQDKDFEGELKEFLSTINKSPSMLFWHCDALTEVKVDEGNPFYKSESNCVLTKDGGKLVLGCKGSVIPFGVTEIGAYAFADCRGLTSIVIPDSVTTIADCAFNGCSGLTGVVIPDSVKNVEYAAFCDSGLERVEVPKSVTSIGFAAFASCEGLRSIHVDSRNPNYKSENNCLLTKSGKTLLTGCATSVIPNGVTKIGASAFRYCTALQSIEIPDSVTSIGDGAFLCCNALTEIVIPVGVTEIADEAFYECTALTKIWLPETLTSIGTRAFFKCGELSEITYSGTQEQWEKIEKGESWKARRLTVYCTEGTIDE